MFGLGTTELLIIAFIVFVIFGAKRIPEIGKGFGQAIRELRKVKTEQLDSGDETDKKEEDPVDSSPNEDKTS